MHSPYIKEQPNARRAVLMIHGICGTPRRFDWLIPEFGDNWSVYNILLDGHGGSAEAFSQTSMKKWKEQVHTALQNLSEKYQQILIIGYSMGTLLAMEAQPHFPRVTEMILFNVPLCPRVSIKMLPRALRIALGKPNLTNPHEAIQIKETGVQQPKNILRYIPWIPRFLELLNLSRHCRKHCPEIQIPCYAYLGKKDELVSPRSGKYLKRIPNARLTVFDTAGHYYISDEDKAIIQSTLRQCIR